MAGSNEESALFQLLLSTAKRRDHADGRRAQRQSLRDQQSLQARGRPQLRLPHRQKRESVSRPNG